MKHSWSAGLLAVVHDWIALPSPKTPSQRGYRVDLMQRVHQGSSTVPQKKSSRIEVNVTEQQAKQLYDERRILIPSAHAQKKIDEGRSKVEKANKHHDRQWLYDKMWKPSKCHRPHPRANWRPKCEKIPEACIASIQAEERKKGKTPRELPRSEKDGAP